MPAKQILRHLPLPAMLLGLSLTACGGTDRGMSDDSIDPPDGGALQQAVRGMLENARIRNDINGYALEIGTADAVLARVAGGDVETLDTPVAIASAGKPVSAAVLLSLTQDTALLPGNRLQLDVPIANYLNADSGGNTQAAQEITVRQLLNHTSGLAQAPDCVEAESDTSLQECAREILEAGTDFTPGSGFAYGAGSYHVAGAVAEVFSGDSWQALVSERVAQPLDVLLPYFPLDNPRVAGGIVTSVDNLATFYRAVLTRDNAILNSSNHDLLRQSQTTTDGGRLPGVTASDYSFGFWLEDAAALASAGPELSSPGFFGTVPWIDEDRGYYAVLLLRQSDYETGLDLMRDIRAEILNRLP